MIPTLDIPSSMIPNLTIPSGTLKHFNFEAKAETENKYYELLADGALTGYLVAEQFNAVRDIVSVLLSSAINDLIPSINTLIQHPAKISTIYTPDRYDLEQLSLTCDFKNRDNVLAVDSILKFPDVLRVDITGSLTDSPLYFPKIMYYKEQYTNINKDNSQESQVVTKIFPSNFIATFEIWINLSPNVSVTNISLPDNYVLLDNEQAFPSELESLTSDESKSTVYVFPIRVSNIADVNALDIQISYAYRFIAGNTFIPIKQEGLSGVIDTTTEIVTNNIENT